MAVEQWASLGDCTTSPSVSDSELRIQLHSSITEFLLSLSSRASILTMKQAQTSIHRQLNAISKPVPLNSVNTNMANPPRYRDNEIDSIDDQLEIGNEIVPAAHPRWYRRGPQWLWGGCLQCRSANRSPMRRENRRRLCRWVMIAIVVLTLLGVIAALSVVCIPPVIT